jgi:hypothetical protein
MLQCRQLALPHGHQSLECSFILHVCGSVGIGHHVHNRLDLRNIFCLRDMLVLAGACGEGPVAMSLMNTVLR